MICRILLFACCIFMNNVYCFSFGNLFKTEADPEINKTTKAVSEHSSSDNASDPETESFIKTIKNNSNLISDSTTLHTVQVTTQNTKTVTRPASEKLEITKNENSPIVTIKPDVVVVSKNATEVKISVNKTSIDEPKSNSSSKETSDEHLQIKSAAVPVLEANKSDIAQSLVVANDKVPEESNINKSSVSTSSTVAPKENPVVNHAAYQTVYSTLGSNETGKQICSQECSTTSCPPGCSIHCCSSETKPISGGSHLLLSEDNNFPNSLQMGASDLEKSFLDTISQLTMKISDNQPLQYSEMISQPQNYYDYLYSPSNVPYGQLFGADIDKKSEIVQQSQYGNSLGYSNLNKKRRTYKRSRIPSPKVKIYTPSGFPSYSESKNLLASDSWDHYSHNQYI